MSVYDLKGNIRKETLGWTDIIKPLYYVSHLAEGKNDMFWQKFLGGVIGVERGVCWHVCLFLSLFSPCCILCNTTIIFT